MDQIDKIPEHYGGQLGCDTCGNCWSGKDVGTFYHCEPCCFDCCMKCAKDAESPQIVPFDPARPIHLTARVFNSNGEDVTPRPEDSDILKIKWRLKKSKKVREVLQNASSEAVQLDHMSGAVTGKVPKGFHKLAPIPVVAKHKGGTATCLLEFREEDEPAIAQEAVAEGEINEGIRDSRQDLANGGRGSSSRNLQGELAAPGLPQAQQPMQQPMQQ
eukprot:CAMPEP_0170639828 /NCGR_PEP_ID=MMETSP0224-20130122/39871_1 /TAXON_ID=285029 /ORGANISM="Togula jolla, Strain CCCM 725" /LENGTH=215 /DNA_ID=CAMNT_0010970237 /DNA_START=42 /DNA_END=686 /DNA_ORIENTATION=+